jgi:hypothetical protein
MIPTTDPAYRPRGQRTLGVTLAINRVPYRVRFLSQGGLQLIKPDGSTYALAAGPGGVACTCPGFEGHGHCKHRDGVRALLRLLAAAFQRRPQTPAKG